MLGPHPTPTPRRRASSAHRWILWRLLAVASLLSCARIEEGDPPTTDDALVSGAGGVGGLSAGGFGAGGFGAGPDAQVMPIGGSGAAGGVGGAGGGGAAIGAGGEGGVGGEAGGRDAGPTDLGFTLDAGCQPGTRLGQCALCGLDGVPELPDDDGTCPQLDCGAGVTYTQRTEGDEFVCDRVDGGAPPANRCRAIGACHDNPAEACGVAAPVEALRVAGPCWRLEGCVGAEPPRAEPNTGAPCEGTGTCQADGSCLVDPCARFVDFAADCGAGETDGEAWCEFYVVLNRRNCNQFCQSNNARCVRAFGNNNLGCSRGNSHNCGSNMDDTICRCSASP